jgi:hypothetical protein
MAKSQSESPLPEPSCHCDEPRLPRTFQVLAMTKGHSRFAKGKKAVPGPGKRTIAFRHCEERKILSLRGVQRRSNLLIRGQPE